MDQEKFDKFLGELQALMSNNRFLTVMVSIAGMKLDIKDIGQFKMLEQVEARAVESYAGFQGFGAATILDSRSSDQRMMNVASIIQTTSMVQELCVRQAFATVDRIVQHEFDALTQASLIDDGVSQIENNLKVFLGQMQDISSSNLENANIYMKPIRLLINFLTSYMKLALDQVTTYARMKYA